MCGNGSPGSSAWGLAAADRQAMVCESEVFILGPKVAQGALEFITNGTIWATPVNKILLDGKPSSPAVDAIPQAVEQVSRNVHPSAVVAALPSRMTTGAQMLEVIAKQQPVAATTTSPTEVANAFGETLHAINDHVSIIEEFPFLTATTPQSPKNDVLRKVHLCRGLVIVFRGTEPVSSHEDNEE
uniref:Uncharacterized protein n=1 Tax=Romanomermis culicivorax TaxID=13658 RepID=A0A915I8P5_ROMCU